MIFVGVNYIFSKIYLRSTKLKVVLNNFVTFVFWTKVMEPTFPLKVCSINVLNCWRYYFPLRWRHHIYWPASDVSNPFSRQLFHQNDCQPINPLVFLRTHNYFQVLNFLKYFPFYNVICLFFIQWCHQYVWLLKLLLPPILSFVCFKANYIFGVMKQHVFYFAHKVEDATENI